MHGEIPTIDGENPVRGEERERIFYETEAKELLTWYTGPIVCEHITTETAVNFVKKYDNVMATITPQHLLLNDMALFHKVKIKNEWYQFAIKMGMMPSMMCMPVLKLQYHVNALWQALIWQYRTQSKKFFLGTDTAYHTHENKYKEECACGVFNSPLAIEMYYMVFKYLNTGMCPGIIDDFQRFTSDIAIEFYKLTERIPSKTFAIIRNQNKIESVYGEAIPPFAGETLPFQLIDVSEALIK